MLIHGCKTDSKLGHFPKIANLFNQNGRGQGVDRAWPRSETNNFYLDYYFFFI